MVSIDVGGKLLTNHLKEMVSYRQWNMMEETHIMNEVKETCCFVSDDFSKDLETCRYVWQMLFAVCVRDECLTQYPVFLASRPRSARPTRNPIVQEYIFPDYSANRPGRIRTPGDPLGESYQTLTMNNERFTVPEILFRPTDIGKYHFHSDCLV